MSLRWADITPSCMILATTLQLLDGIVIINYVAFAPIILVDYGSGVTGGRAAIAVVATYARSCCEHLASLDCR